MKNEFLCPHCKGYLTVAGHIVFTSRTEDGRRGLILLSPKIGNYHPQVNPRYTQTEGEHVDFFCPICNENLAATDVDEKLIKIMMVDDYQNTYPVYFSSVAGEKCTYKIKDGEVEAYGPNSEKYMNFFGEMPKY